MNYLTLFITVPLTVFAVLFAVMNTDKVTVRFLPLDGFAFETQISLMVLGMMGAGFFLGALFVWLYTQKLRFQYWKETRRADRLEKELEQLEKRLGETDTEAENDTQAIEKMPVRA